MEDANDSIIPGTIVDRCLQIGFCPIYILFPNVSDRHDHVLMMAYSRLFTYVVIDDFRMF